MSSPIWSYLFGIFLIAHGIGHIAGFWMGWRSFGALWILGLLGFLAAGLAFFGIGVPHAWWSLIAVASAVVSTILILLFIVAPGPKPRFAAGVERRVLIANVGILMAVLWWHWPAPVGGT
jgi:hypothetical protein